MSKEIDNTGRTTGKHKKSEIGDQFIPYTKEMLQSPAMAVLTIIDRRVLDRLGLEHMAHKATENGNLKCTFDDFVNFGIRRGSISDAIRRVSALGFTEIMKHGGMGKAEFKHPSIYRLTFVLGNLQPTNEWRKFKDIETARRVVAKASKCRAVETAARKKRLKKRLKKQNPGNGFVTHPVTDSIPNHPKTPDFSDKSVTVGAVSNPLLPSISWEGADKATKPAAESSPTQKANLDKANRNVVRLKQSNKKNGSMPIGELANLVLEPNGPYSRIEDEICTGEARSAAQ